VAEDISAGVSVDQVIASKIGSSTVFPSLELATEDFTGYVGACDGFFACAYMNTLSWRTPTEPLPMEINPRSLFERMFGAGPTNLSRVQRMQQDRSILDSVAESVARLSRGLGTRDRQRLSDYLEDIREIERRIQRAERQAATDVSLPAAPVGIPEDFEEHAMLQFDLLALAYAADLTRVFSFMMSRDTSQRVFPKLGITEPHHSLSHHGNKPDSIAALVKINTYQVELFGRFLKKLQATPDGDGSLLDHSVILFGSGMGESDVHSRLDVPTLLVGKGAGLLRGNHHLRTPKETPVANLMLTLSNKFGAEMDRYGISTGTLDI
jgi:hypothetical protein